MNFLKILRDPDHPITFYCMMYMVFTFLMYAVFLPEQRVLSTIVGLIFFGCAVIWLKNRDMLDEAKWLYKISSLVGALFVTYLSVLLVLEVGFGRTF